MTSWKKWLGYAKAKLDDTLSQGNAELDRLEAEQRAEAEAKPWLHHQGDTPSVDDVKAKIDHIAGEAAAGPAANAGGDDPAAVRPPASSDGTSIDFAAQEREARERLDGIRKELGLDGDPGKDGPGGAPPEGAGPPGR